MRRSVKLATIVGVLGLLIATAAQAVPPGRNSSAGRGASGFGSGFSGGPRSFSAQRFPGTQPTYSQRSAQSNRSSFPSPSSRPTTGYRDRNWALQQQRNNQQRNLDQRLGRADHLRGLAEQNGNGRLAESANRMQLRAQQQYERRTQQLDRFGPPPLSVDARQNQNPQNFRQTAGSASIKKPKPSWNERFKQWWPFSRKR